MTPVAQTAIDFCRECLQNRNAAIVCDRVCLERGTLAFFDYADLNAVLEAVRGWCDAHEAGIEMCYYGYLPGEWQCSISTTLSVEEIVHPDLCVALMTACLEASRKLKTA